MCLSIRLVSSMVSFVIVSNFHTILIGTPVIKEPLSERVKDDVWKIVEVTCRKMVGSDVELYVKSQKGRCASVCVCV